MMVSLSAVNRGPRGAAPKAVGALGAGEGASGAAPAPAEVVPAPPCLRVPRLCLFASSAAASGAEREADGRLLPGRAAVASSAIC
jgi:hypothetical protein